jgi:hypothetical protein
LNGAVASTRIAQLVRGVVVFRHDRCLTNFWLACLLVRAVRADVVRAMTPDGRDAAQRLRAAMEAAMRKHAPSVVAVPLSVAVICPSCECVFVVAQRCPMCAGSQLVPLARWLGRAA